MHSSISTMSYWAGRGWIQQTWRGSKEQTSELEKCCLVRGKIMTVWRLAPCLTEVMAEFHRQKTGSYPWMPTERCSPYPFSYLLACFWVFLCFCFLINVVFLLEWFRYLSVESWPQKSRTRRLKIKIRKSLHSQNISSGFFASNPHRWLYLCVGCCF